jgi:hypothetical protein
MLWTLGGFQRGFVRSDAFRHETVGVKKVFVFYEPFLSFPRMTPKGVTTNLRLNLRASPCPTNIAA